MSESFLNWALFDVVGDSRIVAGAGTCVGVVGFNTGWRWGNDLTMVYVVNELMRY